MCWCKNRTVEIEGFIRQTMNGWVVPRNKVVPRDSFGLRLISTTLCPLDYVIHTSLFERKRNWRNDVGEIEDIDYHKRGPQTDLQYGSHIFHYLRNDSRQHKNKHHHHEHTHGPTY